MARSGWLMLLVCWLGGLCAPFSSVRAVSFDLRDGDRVAFVGGVFMEREAEDGYLETVFTRRHPGLNLAFRNFGWGGDTVFRQTRPPKWTNLLETALAEFKPTVIFVSYGLMESLDGKATLPRFMNRFEALINRLEKHAPRIVICSPLRHENLGGLWPDPADHNGSIQLYLLGMGRIARLHNHAFVNFYELLGDGTRSRQQQPYSNNGVHLTGYGYWRAAAVTEQALGLFPLSWRVELDPSTKLTPIRGTELKDLVHATNHVRFAATDEALPAPLAPLGTPEGLSWPN
ncbi:MAG: hypothetical protein HYZ36_07225, partial [Pedosphaera parvula]|nr:hypothetical protein [Pedosphaera parvula]